MVEVIRALRWGACVQIWVTYCKVIHSPYVLWSSVLCIYPVSQGCSHGSPLTSLWSWALSLCLSHVRHILHNKTRRKKKKHFVSESFLFFSVLPMLAQQQDKAQKAHRVKVHWKPLDDLQAWCDTLCGWHLEHGAEE